jgi:nucleoside-diphosphate-sugar epimerase
VARILVTGTAGFIGTALCPALAAQGHSVVAALRREAPAPPRGVETAIVGDITATTDWRRVLRGVEIVIHLAQRAHAGPDAAALAGEPPGTVALTRALAEAGGRRLLLMSSVKAMGEATAPGRPFHVGDEPRPEDAYGQTKLASERAATEAARDAGVELVIVRSPLVYGPGVKANLAALMRLIASGVPLPFAAVDNRRSLIGRDNLVELLVIAAAHPSAPGLTLLAHDDKDLSTPALICALAGGMDRPARLFAVPNALFAALRPLPGIGPRLARLTQSLQVDDGATRAVLGWAPRIPAKAALAAMARAFAAGL